MDHMILVIRNNANKYVVNKIHFAHIMDDIITETKITFNECVIGACSFWYY